jgi:hypothetical protein
VTLTTGTENLFRALGVRPALGRMYREEQSPQGGSEAVISDELWGRRYRRDPNVLGRVVRIRGTPTTIVGVMPPLPVSVATGWGDVWTCMVGDVRQQRLDLPPWPEYYTTFPVMPMPFQSIVVRGERGRAPSVVEVRRVVHQLDPGLALANLMPLEQWVRLHTRERQFALSILSAFSTLALVLGVIGVYGAVSFTVAQRRREIGLRLALGSSPRGVQTLVLLDGSRMMLFGTVLGTLVALIGSPITRGLLFGVAPVDPVVYLAVPALLMCAGLVACWWPARSAARTELVEVLRTE